MLCANLSQYDHVSDTIIRQVPLVLSDDTIRCVMKHLEAGQEALNLNVKVRELGCDVLMRWDRSSDAFLTHIDGMSAGLILGDEMRGALGKPVPQNYKTCSVRLSSELDIWRRGVVDLERGEVLAYTAMPGLATLGASAFLTDTGSLDGAVNLDEEGIDALHFDLQEHDPSRAVFRLGMTDTRRLQSHLGPASAEETAEEQEPRVSPAMESLQQLLSLVAEQHEPACLEPAEPAKGLR